MIYNFYPQAVHLREVKTAIYCYLHYCSALLLWSASLCPPLSFLAHDKRVIDSETDTLGCFLAAHQQQSLSSSFRSLSSLMKDGRWNSMAVITTVAPSLPLDLVRDHTALSVPYQQWDQASTMLHRQCRIFGLLFSLNGTFVFWCMICISHICKYLWVCFTHIRTLQLILF